MKRNGTETIQTHFRNERTASLNQSESPAVKAIVRNSPGFPQEWTYLHSCWRCIVSPCWRLPEQKTAFSLKVMFPSQKDQQGGIKGCPSAPSRDNPKGSSQCQSSLCPVLPLSPSLPQVLIQGTPPATPTQKKIQLKSRRKFLDGLKLQHYFKKRAFIKNAMVNNRIR